MKIIVLSVMVLLPLAPQPTASSPVPAAGSFGACLCAPDVSSYGSGCVGCQGSITATPEEWGECESIDLVCDAPTWCKWEYSGSITCETGPTTVWIEGAKRHTGSGDTTVLEPAGYTSKCGYGITVGLGNATDECFGVEMFCEDCPYNDL